MNRLAGRVAVITGGASGLGRVGAELFAAEGAQVVVADLSDGDEVVDAIAATGGEHSSPAIAPRSRLDYVLVPLSTHVTSRLSPAGGEHWQRLSDHLPVLVEFTL